MVTVITGFLVIFRHAGLATPTVQREHLTTPKFQPVLDKPRRERNVRTYPSRFVTDHGGGSTATLE